VSVTGYLETPWDALEGSVTGETEGNLITGALKLVFDGAPGCSMCLGWWQTAGVTLSAFAMGIKQRSLDPVRAALSTAPQLGKKIRSGIQIYRHEEAQEIVQAAADRGFALAIHAIGNAAIDVALSAYEACGSRVGNAGVPRIEHATFLDDELIARIAGVGAATVVQPHFLHLPAMAAAPTIPGLKLNPLAALLEKGVRVRQFGLPGGRLRPPGRDPLCCLSPHGAWRPARARAMYRAAAGIGQLHAHRGGGLRLLKRSGHSGSGQACRLGGARVRATH
ncbi:MAG TPA: amidohydrolase family protein, partial [Polyangiaceae bacterium]|nr:amidohydrolase family protein [Polyangiaceae bacterium]